MFYNSEERRIRPASEPLNTKQRFQYAMRLCELSSGIV